jgi:23S rRNA (uracil1939-C5)-methyltransferase
VSPQSIQPGSTVTLRVETLAFGGKGIARVDGYTVFVERGLPGQLVEARVFRKKKGFAEARLLRVVEPGTQDVLARCTHFGVCGGCALQNLDYAAQLEAKRDHVKDCLVRLAGLSDIDVETTLASPRTYEYRNKMEYSFGNAWKEEGKPTEDRMSLGLHVRGRFDRVVEIERCHLQDATGSEIVTRVRDFALESGLPAYSTKTHRGFWRFLILRDGVHTGERMVVIITNRVEPGGREWREVERLGAMLKARVPEITSLLHGMTDSKAGVAVCQSIRVLSGESVLREKLLDLTFEIGPNTFFQTNTLGAEQLFTEALNRAQITEQSTVWDLYCGVGALSLPLARQAGRVIGIEIVPASVEAARRNAELNGMTHVAFHAGDVKALLGSLAASAGKPDLIVMDPPRDGVHADVLQTILEIAPDRLLYISCNPSTLARDLGILTSGGYRSQRVLPVDLFPHTPHIEALTTLARASSN